jgi:very-short-patch-repair endonuclease
MQKFYSQRSIEIARELRRHPTEAEKTFWQHVRNRRLGGLKFTRQFPVGRYIVDFYCDKIKLAIELEGSIHDTPEQQEYDAERKEEIESTGMTIIVFRNEEVLEELETVTRKILEYRDNYKE